ncbi:cytochrome P450 [Nonomuraea sp. PA05]|uniref:cytochrome P450 n=1 Tax=Nonomuraea sp. PA05 TaxID=2604466 RepID=UPI0016521E92|nr:cytochrome P450 [Nonomuraea sp. PA05]
MRIIEPQADILAGHAGVNLADPDFYATGNAHLAWRSMRTTEPLLWHDHPREGFWVVTRRADVRRVLGEHETFSSQHGTSIAMLGAPDPGAGLMMQATDPPRHQRFREQLGRPLSAHAVSAYEEDIRSIVRRTVAPARDGGVWDAAAAIKRIPMAVAAHLMRLPDADVDPLMRLAYATLAPRDPLYRIGGEEETLARAHYEISHYFSGRLAERRRQPSSDLLSYLMSIEVEGRRLNERELLLNCLSMIVGAVVTTSHAVSATLMALADAHGGEGRWPSHLRMDSFVEEALRWSSPITHFMRRARKDVELHGRTIAAGQAVTSWIASANRDENVFDHPYAFDHCRRPNRHVAFGSGPHRCVGAPLARLMLKLIFEELRADIECFEPVGEPAHVVSNQVAGVNNLPLRVKARQRDSVTQ